MANYVQYNGNVGSSYYNFFLSQVPMGEDYIIFRTDNNYLCIYGKYEGNNTFKDSTVISISTTYNQQGEVTYTNEATTTYSLSYEYYTYSNVGVGTVLQDPRAYNDMPRQLTFQSSILFILLLCMIGFNILRKRWIDHD